MFQRNQRHRLSKSAFLRLFGAYSLQPWTRFRGHVAQIVKFFSTQHLKTRVLFRFALSSFFRAVWREKKGSESRERNGNAELELIFLSLAFAEE